MISQMGKRQYTQVRRAQQQAETRERIIEAAMALHEEAGPRETTISAIAARAGVQRLTVYRHFPDQPAIFEVCTSRWLQANPLPSPTLWQTIADPLERTRAALMCLYGYYRRTARMWAVSHRDEPDVDALREPMAQFRQYLSGIRDRLVDVFPLGPDDQGPLAAVLGHCLEFTTWQSLAARELEDRDMAHLAVQWARAVAVPAPD
jgi:AcrR family transcriptional regulator